MGCACRTGLMSVFRLPPVDIASHDDEDPEAAAMAVRARWDLGFRPIKNMVRLLEAHGARVYSLAEDVKQVDAYSFWSPSRQPFVFLNMSKSAERSRMDAAHELGHLVMHPWGGTLRSAHKESQANRFASALLMPAGSVLARVPRNPPLAQIVRAKAYWKVSARRAYLSTAAGRVAVRCSAQTALGRHWLYGLPHQRAQPTQPRNFAGVGAGLRPPAAAACLSHAHSG